MTLIELERRQRELTRLNEELEDTNRGVMALYAELDERANRLREADEIKTRFFANVSHEFRTPLNSVLALAKLLLDEADGPLNEEQRKQVALVQGAARELYDLVSDLLDLAKVEAGKSTLTVTRFTVQALFGALRGMMRPVLAGGPVTLEFEAAELPPLVGDEGKVAQVLRNLLSNAAKFTERGSIGVGARLVKPFEPPAEGVRPLHVESVLFSVADTGIGIAAADRDAIFDEFTQVRNAVQRDVRGTGLGLPLCRKLASLMGGRIWVESELGQGSTFYFLVPRLCRPAPHDAASADAREAGKNAAAKVPLLVVADADDEALALGAAFRDTAFAAVTARAANVSSDYLAALEPCAAVAFERESDVRDAAAEEGRAAIGRAGIPLLRLGGDQWDEAETEEAVGPSVVRSAYRTVIRSHLGRVLLVDDEESFRTILARCVQPFCIDLTALGDPTGALDALRAGGADCVVLDLLMPGIDGFTLLEALRGERETRHLPVLVCSSKELSQQERRLLGSLDAAFLAKSRLDPERLAGGLVEAWSRSRRGSAGAESGRGVDWTTK